MSTSNFQWRHDGLRWRIKLMQNTPTASLFYCRVYSKKTFYDVWNCESEYLSQVCEHKFRDDKDVNQWLMRYWQIASGYFEPRSPNFGKMYDVGENMQSVINDINKGNHKTIL